MENQKTALAPMQAYQQHTSTRAIRNVLPFLIPALLLCSLTLFLWPYFQYYIDPDAISYLNITERYVIGDDTHAVNAFWSPMGCWLTAILVKITGWPLFASAIIINTLPALGMVISGQFLFQKFRSNNWEHWCFGCMSAFFWTYTIYFQSFTDIWQFFWLTIGLLILLKEGFTSKPGWWFCIGLVAALSYFGKAYSFYFFPLMILVVTGMKLKAAQNAGIQKLVLIFGVSVGVMLLSISPWLLLIHEKYGIWTSSTAGKLNMSWWLIGTQEFKESVKVLVPPPYNGSLFYFEDPYLIQGHIAHFWDSPKLFAKQIARTGFNVIGWVNSANRISAFYFFIWIFSILLLLSKSSGIFKPLTPRILLVVFLIFPLPYWLLTFDGGRYLWFTIPLCSILALYIADAFLFAGWHKRLRQSFIAVFFLSFLITPVADMKTMFQTGVTEYKIAQHLRELKIEGSFASNLSYADAAERIIRIAWFSKNPWYCHTLNNFSTEEVLKDAARYRVKYYYYFYNGTGADYQFKDIAGKFLPDLTKGSIPGLKVYQIGN